MYIYILILIVALISVPINKKVSELHILTKQDIDNKKFYILPFLVLAIFSALRYGIGIDYQTYQIHIMNIQSDGMIYNPNIYIEPGFQIIIEICAAFITKDPVFVMCIMSFLTNFFFLKVIYDQSKDIKLSIFFYLTWGYYFLAFNSIRSYFAMALALYSLRFVINKKYVRFLILIIIAALFHKSALICIPFYIIANRELKPIHFVFSILALAAVVIFKNQIETLIFKVYPSYLGSVYDVNEFSYLNILKGIAVVGLGCLFYQKVKSSKLLTVCFNLNFFALVFYCVCYWVPQASRIGFYFNITCLILIPNLLKEIENKNSKYLISFVFIVLSLVLFFMLMKGFYSSSIQLLPYKSWLFS